MANTIITIGLKRLEMELVTYKGCVYPWQCDHVGHMNTMWYAGKFDEATWNLLAALGITPSYLREHHRGMVAVQQNINYKQELLAGDIVEVRSRVLEVREKVVRFVHEMRNGETDGVCAISELTGVHTNRQTRKSCPFEPGFMQKIQAMIPAAPEGF
jgi:acyl-CoA thioester hydrolase